MKVSKSLSSTKSHSEIVLFTHNINPYLNEQCSMENSILISNFQLNKSFLAEERKFVVLERKSHYAELGPNFQQSIPFSL